MLKSNQYVSPSKIKAWRSCPHRAKYEPFRRSTAMDFGDAVHAGIAAHFRGGEFEPEFRKAALANNVPADMIPRGIEAFQRILEHKAVNVPLELVHFVESDDVLTRLKEAGKKEDDHGIIYTFDDGRTRPCFKSEVVPGQWGLRGSMDMVAFSEDGTTLRIIDWKTGMSEEEDNLQLACYAIAAAILYPGFAKIEAGFFYLERGRYQAEIFDTHDLANVFETVGRDVVGYLNEKDWAPKVNKYCGYCSLKDKCPAFKNAVTKVPDKASWDIDAHLANLPLIIDNYEKIEAIAKCAYSIAESLKEKRAQILLANGQQIINGRTYKAVEQVSTYEYDLGRIFTGVQAITGQPPLEICKFDSGGFDDLVKTLPADQKKAAKKVKEDNRQVKSKSVRVTCTIAKEAKEDEQE